MTKITDMKWQNYLEGDQPNLSKNLTRQEIGYISVKLLETITPEERLNLLQGLYARVNALLKEKERAGEKIPLTAFINLKKTSRLFKEALPFCYSVRGVIQAQEYLYEIEKILLAIIEQCDLKRYNTNEFSMFK